MSKCNTPWWVYVGELRPNFPTKIVAICDNSNRPVIPWGGFDSTGLSHAKQKSLAKFIVDAVNAFEETPKP